MDKLVTALGPAFAAGFAVQQLLEILDPFLDKFKKHKKPILGILSLTVGLVLAYGAGLRVLQPLGITNPGFCDVIVTGLIVSAGTEGFNSIMKFMGYSKDRKNPDADGKQKNVGAKPLASLNMK